MSDETNIVCNQGNIFLGGPPLVKAAIGEVSAEDPRWRRAPRGFPAGDPTADNDLIALQLARIVANPELEEAAASSVPPRASSTPSELHGVIPTDAQNPR